MFEDLLSEDNVTFLQDFNASIHTAKFLLLDCMSDIVVKLDILSGQPCPPFYYY